MKRSAARCTLSTVFAVALCSQLAIAQTWKYPEARRDSVVDVYHGTKVADPYRWLEAADSPETQAWVDAQNRLTQGFVNTPEREKLRVRLTDLLNYERYTVPSRHEAYYAFWKNDGLQNQSVLYMQEGLDGLPKVVIDPNLLSPDGTISVSSSEFTDDGALLAYGLSQSGSDWQEVHIRNVNTGEDYPDLLEWCRFASIAWAKDNSGFYYDRYPDTMSVPEEDRNNYNRVCWHTVGTMQAQDALVYERPDDKELGLGPTITEDGQYLLIGVSHGTSRKTGLYYREANSGGNFTQLLPVDEAKYSFIVNDGAVFYIHTDLDAPKGRIIAIDTRKPERKHWREVVPQAGDVVHFVSAIDRRLVVAYLHDVSHVVKVHDLDGRFLQDLELPTLGSLAKISGRFDHPEMFFGFTSFTFPTRIYRHDFTTGTLSLFRDSDVDFDAAQYETNQVFFNSKDGTRIPMFLTHKKGLKLDGHNPTLLYGYGGFTASMTPFFSATRLVWLENGGVFAVVCLRGGNEYGEAWHRAGMLENKQNVFDDFIAAGEWLIANGYTETPKLAMNGGSNGGLLVAACLVQRPDLIGAAVLQVPVIDMLRYHKFTVGHYWANEYGNAETNPDHFKFLYAYSPLHNVKKGVGYPPTFITTADTDDRVVPAHGKKFAAALQANDAGKNPILLRIETKAGHGGGKPTSKIIEEEADIYAFLFKVLGMGAPAESPATQK